MCFQNNPKYLFKPTEFSPITLYRAENYLFKSWSFNNCILKRNNVDLHGLAITFTWKFCLKTYSLVFIPKIGENRSAKGISKCSRLTMNIMLPCLSFFKMSLHSKYRSCHLVCPWNWLRLMSWWSKDFNTQYKFFCFLFAGCHHWLTFENVFSRASTFFFI